MFQILFFIFFIILMHILSKKLEEVQRKQTSEEKEFEIFGLPPLEFPLPEKKPLPQKTKKIPITKIETPKITTEEKKKVTPTTHIAKETKTEERIEFDNTKLEEAIIFSEILGPPKALRK